MLDCEKIDLITFALSELNTAYTDALDHDPVLSRQDYCERMLQAFIQFKNDVEALLKEDN